MAFANAPLFANAPFFANAPSYLQWLPSDLHQELSMFLPIEQARGDGMFWRRYRRGHPCALSQLLHCLSVATTWGDFSHLYSLIRKILGGRVDLITQLRIARALSPHLLTDWGNGELVLCRIYWVSKMQDCLPSLPLALACEIYSMYSHTLGGIFVYENYIHCKA